MSKPSGAHDREQTPTTTPTPGRVPNHTPGPWGVGPAYPDAGIPRANIGAVGASGHDWCYIATIMVGTQENDANARLIAAAPALLAALRAMTAGAGVLLNSLPALTGPAAAAAHNLSAQSDHARAALAKAEGRA